MAAAREAAVAIIAVACDTADGEAAAITHALAKASSVAAEASGAAAAREAAVAISAAGQTARPLQSHTRSPRLPALAISATARGTADGEAAEITHSLAQATGVAAEATSVDAAREAALAVSAAACVVGSLGTASVWAAAADRCCVTHAASAAVAAPPLASASLRLVGVLGPVGTAGARASSADRCRVMHAAVASTAVTARLGPASVPGSASLAPPAPLAHRRPPLIAGA